MSKMEVKRNKFSKASIVSKKELVKIFKHSRTLEKLKKPFGFCCDEKSQDFITKYNQQRTPFASCLTEVVLNGGGPDLKFRINDTLPKYATKSGRSYLKTTIANLGGCKWCRGPLQWYLEDEISVAQAAIEKDRKRVQKGRTKRNHFRQKKVIIFLPNR